ncbi:MAG: hypothetical protein M3Z08_09140, partial [Chloroflexota bacterium]|nr:hypothetical protein [Chloroflexota bacterium]
MDQTFLEKHENSLGGAPLISAPQPSSRHWFRKPTREQILAWAPFWGVILLGVVLRFWDLGAKPLHHDESQHAYFSLGLLQNT